MKRSSVLGALFCGLALSSCGPEYLHPISTSLGRELAEKSKSGLGLARFSTAGNMIDLHFFDGRNEKVPLEIDGELKVVTQGRIAVVVLDPTRRRTLANATLR